MFVDLLNRCMYVCMYVYFFYLVRSVDLMLDLYMLYAFMFIEVLNIALYRT